MLGCCMNQCNPCGIQCVEAAPACIMPMQECCCNNGCNNNRGLLSSGGGLAALIILILVILQFSGKKTECCPEKETKCCSDGINQSILFIIVLFFLSCGYFC